MINQCTDKKHLSNGGQKIVYIANHPTYGKVVIKEGPIESFTGLERMRREVELLSSLDSEFYPKQYHFGIDITEKKFQIMEEYIEGSTLRNSMSKFSNKRSIFNLLALLVEGLSIIREKNIVHRDLKPENIIIRPNGKPCIIDLGIARFLELETLTPNIAPHGPCTPSYAAPEQITNNQSIISPRTDFFTLGIISLELYLGVNPFKATSNSDIYSIVEKIMQNDYITETELIKSDEQIIEFTKKTLQTEPYNRFRNYKIMQQFINNLA